VMPLNPDAANFLQYDFAETKDLSMHFLTVVIAVLVFSLTFAEKIAGFNGADRVIRAALTAGWCNFLLSIVFCGIAILLPSFGRRRCCGQFGYRTILATYAYGNHLVWFERRVIRARTGLPDNRRALRSALRRANPA
jgi:hypothetical protein